LADLNQLQKTIGIKFKNPAVLSQALVHSSYINENPGLASVPNERLEFLGDAVLGLIIAEKLYQDLPESAEGELTLLRSALVRREALAQAARTIGLGDYLLLGKGEEAGGGRDKAANLAGALEALIASIYLDRGLNTTRNFILKLFGPQLYSQAHQGAGTDYKSQLQEIIQAERQITPSYHLIEAVGPDHDKRFTIEVHAGDSVLGIGIGKSKKTAEMEAARSALEKLSNS
jgi:ribonuclease III